MVFEELCLNMYHHIITEGHTMGKSSLVQQVLYIVCILLLLCFGTYLNMPVKRLEDASLKRD